MLDISIDRIKSIKTFPSLVVFLRDELNWRIEQSSFFELDEISFRYSTEELGLQEKFASKIRDIRQLRPVPGQPWGVFWIDFEPKHMPIGALRKILNYFVHKKRASAGDRATWAMDDLLFIAGTGESGHRGTTFAHFHKTDDGGEELKEFSWDETETHFHYILDYLGSLRWPEGADQNKWREQWRNAFRGSTRKAIKTAEQLAVYMADLARDMRKRVNDAFEVESEKGPLHAMLNTFKKTLIHDLEPDAFADMYAQTVTYGLFSARCMDTDGHFELHEVVDRVPDTNPFLKGLFQECFKTAKKSKDNLNFDELGINRLVELLDDLNQKDGTDRMQEILREFGRQTRGEDPVIHFYEGFLNEYESEQRKRRGVYYTPDPVVSYIVRSVDEILRKEFGLELGLADTSTWGDLVATGTLARPEGMHQSSKEWKELSKQPFVQILDPATGTGTFLKHTVLLIYSTMTEKWKKDGCSREKISELWNEYVPAHLLTRIFGFELMMAPYAVCHMKLGLVLKETGYKFKANHRLQVYLTNTLEPPHADSGLPLFDSYLADEVRSANNAKSSKRFTVVIGNPPYSASISEPLWLMQSLGDWKRGLNETKIDLNREEWKFMRYGQTLCDQVPKGIMGYIINRDFLDGVAKRRMRESLQESFSYRMIIDLNGDVKGNIADENVFDITQGVCIAILCHGGGTEHRFFSLIGTRQEKYTQLSNRTQLDCNLVPFVPSAPYFRWVPFKCKDHAETEAEYLRWLPLNEIFCVYSSGIQTKRDDLCVHFDKKTLWNTVRDFHSLSSAATRKKFGLGEDGRDWTVALAKADIAASGPNSRHISPILYRPFDIRYTYWTGRTKGFIAYPRREVMQHVVGRRNVGLIFNRQVVGDNVSHFGVSRIPICHGTFYLGNKGQDYFAPLFILKEKENDLLSAGSHGLEPNFTRRFITALSQAFGETWKTLTSEETFNYAYAVFHSPGYRSRYSEFLKMDFPRLPLIGNLELFQALAQLGGELVAFHLMESPKLDKQTTKWLDGKNPEVEKVSWSEDTVWVDKVQSIGFKGVPEVVWNFHVGGYQVCEKWLKDRKGRTLSKDDIDHYQKIVFILSETIRIMSEIDEVIDSNGGWPKAFEQNKNAPQ